VTGTGPAGLRRFVRPQAGPPGPAGSSGSAAPAAPATTGPTTAGLAAAGPTAPGQGPAAAARPTVPGGLTGTSAARDRPGEACEMCGTSILDAHGHVVDLERSSLLCTCRPCYLLFTHSQAGGGRWRAVPDRYLSDPGRPLSAAEWDELEIPVGLAFFLRSSANGQVAGFYPSPAGVTECQLDLGRWQRMAAEHPLLGEAEADVEAVLIHRDGSTVEHFVVPVDVCYELAGRLRLLWRGFDGGDEARDAIAEFLGLVASQARALAAEPGP